MLIVGPCGTGKSHLAQALGHCAMRVGHDVAVYSQTRLLDRLREERAAGSGRTRRPLATLPLLILDDFGLKPLVSPEDELLHQLVAERYERAATIVTSNLDFREWGEAFPENAVQSFHQPQEEPNRNTPFT